MKKNFTLLIIICFSLQTYAQLTIGLKGGYTHAWPEYGDVDLPEGAETAVSGLNVGIFIEKQLDNGLVISTSPACVERGAACLPGWQPQFDGDSKVFIDVIEFPLQVGKVFQLKSLDFHIVTSVGYGISCLYAAQSHQEIMGVGGRHVLYSDISIGNDAEDQFNRFDHGIYLNLRIQRHILRRYSAIIESAFYAGMQDFDKQNTSKARSLNFNIGIAYHL